MVTEIWVNFGSGNGLVPDGTKPLPELMLTSKQESCTDDYPHMSSSFFSNYQYSVGAITSTAFL